MSDTATEKTPAEPTERSIQVQYVFEHWRVRMGIPRARLDQKRRSKIRMRLDDGYTVDDLVEAIEGCAMSAFHMGDNDRGHTYNDIELICRDARHVDQFIGIKSSIETKRRREEMRQRAQAEYSQRKAAELRSAGRGHLKVAA